jgi:glucose-1-phosphate adenylyltransferase
MPANSKLLAVILGGGAGNRLFPLTQQRSKPAVPLGGKYRLVDIALSNCINSDVLRTFVLTQYNSASLNRHIAQTYRFSHFSNGFVEILAAEQRPDSPEWFQGTADAVRQVLPHIRDWGIDTLLILSGDHLYRMDYRQFLERHHQTNADVTVSVIPSEARSASEFGLLKTDETGRIVEFKEKPKGDDLLSMRVDTTQLGLDANEAQRRPYLASMGIYVFKYDQLEQLLKEDHSWMDFGKHVIPAAIKSRHVQAFMFDGYWEDIGTIGAFYRANLDLTSKIPKFNLFDAEAPVLTRARYLPPSKARR